MLSTCDELEDADCTTLEADPCAMRDGSGVVYARGGGGGGKLLPWDGGKG